MISTIRRTVPFLNTPVQKRVRKGKQFLDKLYPDWREHVDIEILSMRNPHTCVLGQLGGDFYDVIEDLHIPELQAYKLGFDRKFCGDHVSWTELEEEWKAVIKA